MGKRESARTVGTAACVMQVEICMSSVIMSLDAINPKLVQPRKGQTIRYVDVCQGMHHVHTLPAAWANSQGIQGGLSIASFTDFGDGQIVGPICKVNSTPVDHCIVRGCYL